MVSLNYALISLEWSVRSLAENTLDVILDTQEALMSEPASSEEIGKRTSNNETSPSIRKHKRHKSRRHRYKHVVKLLTLAAEGQHRKVAKLLERHKSLDIDSYNAKGFTALHQVGSAFLFFRISAPLNCSST